MRDRTVRKYSISDIIDWHSRGELIIAPYFQRREVWSEKARSHLIDTILRNLPIPLLIFRLSRDLRSGRNIREVVDGQQRLISIIDFYNGDLSINKIHNEDFDGFSFNQLPEEHKHIFMDYELAVSVLTGATNSEVLDIFARLNSYTVVLNRQEKLNAKYHGDFKTFIYKNSNEKLDFFTENKILSNRRIIRMGEAELLSELVIAIMDGLQDKKKSIEKFYYDNDEEFSDKKSILTSANVIFNMISDIFGDDLKFTNFRRVALFYSLFCALYDVMYGIPNQETQQEEIESTYYSNIKDSLLYLSEQIDLEEPNEGYNEFVQSCTRQTDNIRPRQIRHEFIKNAIISALS